MKKISDVLKIVNKLTALFLDFILPKSKRAKELDLLTPEKFLEKIKNANPISVVDARALFSYKDPLVKDTIWLLKYQKNRRAAEILGEILGNITAEWLDDLKNFENFNNPLLVPVPMGKSRLKERGKNHCESLCEEMIKAVPIGLINYEPNALSKIRETGSQAKTKNRLERLKNLSDSFSANQHIVQNRNILLIDDVITTGATIEEARKTLLKAGAKKVIALTVAH